MGVLVAAFVTLAWNSGCAHAHLERYVDGEKVCEIESWVLGTGETEQVTNSCGDYAYSTENTGISDNGKDALGMVAEGAARGIMPLP
jgi:hypothetical protein